MTTIAPVPCHACAGKFSLSVSNESGTPVAHHTLPYCPAFDALESSLDALAFAERCGMTVGSAQRAGSRF